MYVIAVSHTRGTLPQDRWYSLLDDWVLLVDRVWLEAHVGGFALYLVTHRAIISVDINIQEKKGTYFSISIMNPIF
jgi:hypothetical protein